MHFLTHLLQHYGYFGLFGALALEYLFFPVPGETTLTTAGILAQNPKFHLSVPFLILATGLGSFVGSLIGYVIGRIVGRPFLDRFGKIVRLTPARVDKAQHFFAKYTLPALIISRFIAGIRILVPYLAGINRVPLGLYMVTMLLSSLAWTSTFILAGSVIVRAWHTIVAHWRVDLIPAIIIVALLATGYVYLHRWLAHKIEAPEPPAQGSKKSDKR